MLGRRRPDLRDPHLPGGVPAAAPVRPDVWTFLDEARQPSLIRPGTIVLAGDDDAPAVAEVVDLIPKEAGTVVHLRILPGLFDDYEALVRRVHSRLDDGTSGSPGV